MEINPKLYKLIKKFITREIKGSDVFIHNGSKWLIFEEDKKWVIELTKEGTLWYNYYFFQNIFELVDLDVVENQHYITKWVEDNVINGVKEARALEEWVNSEKIVDKTIQNGVKKSQSAVVGRLTVVEDTIQNGVKDTREMTFHSLLTIEDTIQNGVKETKHNTFEDGLAMEEVIQNGVKQTHLAGKDRKIGEIKDIIENGVKETNMEEHHRLREVVQTVKDGIKETTPGGYLGSVEMNGNKIHQFETAKQLYYVEDVIESGIKKTEGAMLFDESQIDRVISDGIKEVQPLPAQEGNMDWGNYYYRQPDRTKAHIKYVDDAIRDGVKETWGYEKQPQNRINEVIENGTKENPS